SFHDSKKFVPAAEGWPSTVNYSYSGATSRLGSYDAYGTLFFYILPFIDQQPLYTSAATPAPPNSHNIGAKVVGVYLCPSDASMATPSGGCGVMQSDN